MKYREKPVVIEAFKWTGDSEQTEDPKWIVEAIEKGEVYFINPNTDKVIMAINTLEGTMYASRGDYIIKGIQDELYPCKPDIFEATYEKGSGKSLEKLSVQVSVADTDLFKDLLSVVELAANGASQEESRLRLEKIVSQISSSRDNGLSEKRNEPRNGYRGVKGTRMSQKAVFVPDFKGEYSEIKQSENGKYYVEFDKIPALLFISHDGLGTSDQVFVHGEEHLDSKNITIKSAPAELTTYEKESYVAVKTEGNE